MERGNMRWKYHNKYAKKLGISEEISRYVNRIVDNINPPSEYIRYVKNRVRSLKGKTAFPYVVADYMINRGHDAGRRRAKEITSEIQLEFLRDKGEDYERAWYLHHTLDLIWDNEDLLEDVSKLESTLIKKLVQIYPERMKYYAEIINFIRENKKALKRDIKNIKNASTRIKTENKELVKGKTNDIRKKKESLILPSYIIGGLKIWFKCSDRDKVLKTIYDISGLMLSEFGIFEVKKGVCYIPFDLRRIGLRNEWRPTNQKLAKYIDIAINEMKNRGMKIYVDTETGADPDTGLIYPVDYKDIVFISKKKEKIEPEEVKTLADYAVEEIAEYIAKVFEKEEEQEK